MKVLLVLAAVFTLAIMVKGNDDDVQCNNDACTPGNVLSYDFGDGVVCCDPDVYDYFQIKYTPPKIWEGVCVCRKN